MALNAGIVWAVIVLIAYSFADLFGKKVVLKFGYKRATALVSAISIVPFLILYFAYPAQPITEYSIELSAVAGIFYGVGFMLLYKALVTEQTTNTFALSEFFKAWLVLFGALIAGSVLGLGQWSGIALIFLGSFMVITTENLHINKRLVYALSGFICWAVLWTMMYYAIINSRTYVPEGFIAAFFALLTAIIVYAMFPDRKHAVAGRGDVRHWAGYAAIVGLAIGSGSLIFGFLIISKMLAQGAAIIALTPIVVAIASKRTYLDRLTKVQVAGILVAVSGALVLAFL